MLRRGGLFLSGLHYHIFRKGDMSALGFIWSWEENILKYSSINNDTHEYLCVGDLCFRGLNTGNSGLL